MTGYYCSEKEARLYTSEIWAATLLLLLHISRGMALVLVGLKKIRKCGLYSATLLLIGYDFVRAEFMLDVIGAGATAKSTENWHDIWKRSKESKDVQEEINTIHSEGRNRPTAEQTSHTELVTSWGYQTIQLVKRDAQYHYRDPTYLVAKLVLNIFGGLFIGFSFFKSKDTQQGTQNKLFVSRRSCLVGV